MSTGSLLPGSAKSEQQHRADVCVAGRWMYERGYIVACEGNLSVRLDEERVLTTPTCMNKGMLSPDDLVIIDLEGRHVAGDRKASSELAMHLLFYRMRPDVHAICHAHPPTATGFAVAGRALDAAPLDHPARRPRRLPRSSVILRATTLPRPAKEGPGGVAAGGTAAGGAPRGLPFLFGGERVLDVDPAGTGLQIPAAGSAPRPASRPAQAAPSAST